MLLSHMRISFKINFLEKKYFRNTTRVTNSLVSDLGPNCLQRLSADGTGRQMVKICYAIVVPGMKYCFFYFYVILGSLNLSSNVFSSH